MIAEIINLITQLVPVWIALLAIAVGYLVFLFKRVADRFLEINEKQSEYLRDRVDVVDKASSILTRTIEQQEKEIDKLTNRVSSLSQGLEEARNQSANNSVTELSTLSEAINDIVKSQQHLIEITSNQMALSSNDELLLLKQLANNAERKLDDEISAAIRRRDLSRYPIKLSKLPGANDLLSELKSQGYAVSIYESTNKPSVIRNVDGQQAIWVGTEVPPSVVIGALKIAKKNWPFLKYVHLSGDNENDPPEDIYSELFFGGSSDTAVNMLGISAWKNKDFDQLHLDMSKEEFHSFIRERY